MTTSFDCIEAHIDSATIQAIAQLIVERFDPLEMGTDFPPLEIRDETFFYNQR